MGEPPANTEFDERAFRRLAELAPDAMIAHDRGTIVWANEASAKLMGVGSTSELIGESVMRFVAPESRDAVAARIRSMLETEQSVPLFEESFVRADGVKVAVEATASSIGGGVVMVVVRDLSARHAAERERRAALARARAFFDATTEALGISRLGTHIEVNAAYAAMFGYDDPGELVGVRVLDLIDPTEHARITANMVNRAMGAPVPSSYSVRALRRGGEAFLMDVHASAYPDVDGLTTVVVMRNVTAQRAAEARLADSERRYRELFDQVPVGVWEEDLSGVRKLVDALRARGVTDLRAHFAAHPDDLLACARAVKVLSANSAACNMVGAKDSQELLQNLNRVFLADSLEPFGDEIASLADGNRLVTTEGWNGTLDGRRRWVALQVAVTEAHEHDWSRVIASTTDLTERRQAREERDALQERLRHGEKLEAVGRLAGGVAHDFNNLLSVILTNTELGLAEAAQHADATASLETIREASSRARDLVRQILTFGRKDTPRPEALELRGVVNDALNLVRAAIPATVSLTPQLDSVGNVLADRTQVHQIVLNLCANARDAVSGKGHIDVQLALLVAGPEVPELKGRRCARLRVKDNGAGMDAATVARIFEPYVSTRTQAGGHGLGLAVVHGIVNGASGVIQVNSAPGHGSTFDVYLPTVEQPARPPTPVPTTSGGTERILLIDDEPLVLSAHRRLLTSLGYRVTIANDGVEALALLRATPTAFDLVISDQAMPKMSGLELVKTLLLEQPAARVLLCTGFSDELDDERARALGLKGLLLKPLNRHSMNTAVRAALQP